MKEWHFERLVFKLVSEIYILIAPGSHHNGQLGISNYRRLDCLLNPLFKLRSKKTSTLCVTGFLGAFTGDRWIPLTKGQ